MRISCLFQGNRKGSPLVEEGMLIGLSLVILAIFTGIILNMLGWTENAITDILNQFQQLFEYLFTN
ncbi:MAG: hypothetical protein ACTSW4_03685 [Candidatus Ranarchaeia archaeon]